MGRLASHSHNESLKLLLFMQLRSPELSDSAELASLKRREAEQEERASCNRPKPGEFVTVPVTTTTVEGIGSVTGVHYGIITYEATSTGAQMENRAVWAGSASGFATFNK